MRRAVLAGALSLFVWASGAADQPVDLNRASAAELTRLPGIGEVLAGRIVESRRVDGPFRSPDDLRRVKGIGAQKLARLRPLLRVGAPPAAATAPPAPQPVPAPPTRPPPRPAATRTKGRGVVVQGRLDLNRAGVLQLQALPGIGPKTAAALVADRTERGPFTRVDDVTRVRGIGKKKLEKIRPFVRVGPEVEKK